LESSTPAPRAGLTGAFYPEESGSVAKSRSNSRTRSVTRAARNWWRPPIALGNTQQWGSAPVQGTTVWSRQWHSKTDWWFSDSPKH